MTVAGNSTSVKGGGTSIEKARRETPPSGWAWPTDARKPTGSGVVWIATIVRLSDVDPAQIDPSDDATLKKYGLERIPTSA